ncbi:hypothetical protein GGTG_04648 [Gaeumannomyces tritici R3-111a-1]|uniref:Uncharacterized protein n=1 Tax=Gaeumannomyces tritici (strain R3-111a-1) TaxID=644352 RepID=J3NTP8_GAET3|nr:hypothetical protein GGTG_04648 [Gaeumannomyces tritici R3-111a-1]EJT79563.1 hypothetical protein GGTG_04648 [Gaeumannomyces tritici R3-111a-1]
MEYTRRALAALGLVRGPAAAAATAAATAPTSNTSPASGRTDNTQSPDQVGPDGKRRCRFFDEQRSEPHPECCGCGHILRDAPPCMCDICHALNFPVPSSSSSSSSSSTSRPVTPKKQGAASSSSSSSSSSSAKPAGAATQTGRDVVMPASGPRRRPQMGEDGGRQARLLLLRQSSSSSSGTDTTASSSDWVRVGSPAAARDGSAALDLPGADDDWGEVRDRNESRQEGDGETAWRAYQSRLLARGSPAAASGGVKKSVRSMAPRDPS